MSTETGFRPSSRDGKHIESNHKPGRWTALLEKLHGQMVLARRVRRLAGSIAELLPDTATVVDVGCGDGRITKLISIQKPGIVLEGYDVRIRPEAVIPVHPFDGLHLPLEENTVDAVIFVDVLHHTEAPMLLLREAYRVTRKFIIIKDHRLNRPCAELILRFMDWIGNRTRNIVLPYNYWSEERWRAVWSEIGMHVDHCQTNLCLYPWPANLVFERGLHFLVRLAK
jgi:SAM-dependent methyltransferase